MCFFFIYFLIIHTGGPDNLLRVDAYSCIRYFQWQSSWDCPDTLEAVAVAAQALQGRSIERPGGWPREEGGHVIGVVKDCGRSRIIFTIGGVHTDATFGAVVEIVVIINAAVHFWLLCGRSWQRGVCIRLTTECRRPLISRDGCQW